jgi:hypothetical protein
MCHRVGSRRGSPRSSCLLTRDPAQLRDGDLDRPFALLLGETDAIEHGTNDPFQRLGLILGDDGDLVRSLVPMRAMLWT